MSAARSSSSNSSAARFSRDRGRLKNGTQMQVSISTRSWGRMIRISLGFFEPLPVVLHFYAPREPFELHAPDVAQILCQRGTNRRGCIGLVGEMLEFCQLLLRQFNDSGHLRSSCYIDCARLYQGWTEAASLGIRILRASAGRAVASTFSLPSRRRASTMNAVACWHELISSKEAKHETLVRLCRRGQFIRCRSARNRSGGREKRAERQQAAGGFCRPLQR